MNGFRTRRMPPSGSGSAGSPLPATPEDEPVGRSPDAPRASACTNSSVGPAAGHRVGDDHVELPLPQHAQPLLPRPHRLDHVPLRREQRAHQPVDRRDRRPPPECGAPSPRRAGAGAAPRVRTGAGASQARQGHPELGAALGRRLVGQQPAVGLHQTVAQREPEAGALAGPLGREERREQVGHEMRRHARPGVPHPEHGLVARGARS